MRSSLAKIAVRVAFGRSADGAAGDAHVDRIRPSAVQVGELRTIAVRSIGRSRRVAIENHMQLIVNKRIAAVAHEMLSRPGKRLFASPSSTPRESPCSRTRSPRLASLLAVAAAGLGRRAGANPDRRPAAGRRPPPRAGSRQHAHRQHRALQPVRFSRHRANRRPAGGAGRIRLRAFERLLSRHMGVEHQLARGLRPLQPVEPRMGFLRRLQAHFPGQRRLELRRRPLLLLLPGPDEIPASSTPTRSRATAPSRGNG